MLWEPLLQTTWEIECHCRGPSEDVCREQTPSAQVFTAHIQRCSERQRWWKTLNTLQRGPEDRGVVGQNHHRRQSAQYLRLSGDIVLQQKQTETGRDSGRVTKLYKARNS